MAPNRICTALPCASWYASPSAVGPRIKSNASSPSALPATVVPVVRPRASAAESRAERRCRCERSNHHALQIPRCPAMHPQVLQLSILSVSLGCRGCREHEATADGNAPTRPLKPDADVSRVNDP